MNNTPSNSEASGHGRNGPGTGLPVRVLVPLPEGASYLGFIFARGETRDTVERSLRIAHGRLTFTLDSEVRLTS